MKSINLALVSVKEHAFYFSLLTMAAVLQPTSARAPILSSPRYHVCGY